MKKLNLILITITIFLSLDSLAQFRNLEIDYYPFDVIMGEDGELIEAPSYKILPYDKISVKFLLKNMFRREFKWNIRLYKKNELIEELLIVAESKNITTDPGGVEFTLEGNSFIKRFWIRDDLAVVTFELNETEDPEQTSIFFVDNYKRLE